MARTSFLFVAPAIVLLLYILVVAECENSAKEAGQSGLANIGEAQYNGAYNKQHGIGLRQSDCPNACSYRCSQTSKRKACMFFCNKCCLKCLCVPPGTYGNKEACPCYNDWKTQQGGPKCP